MYELCDGCKEFHKLINGQHGEMCSCDVFVVCEHNQVEQSNTEQTIKKTLLGCL